MNNNGDRQMEAKLEVLREQIQRKDKKISSLKAEVKKLRQELNKAKWSKVDSEEDIPEDSPVTKSFLNLPTFTWSSDYSNLVRDERNDSTVV